MSGPQIDAVLEVQSPVKNNDSIMKFDTFLKIKSCSRSSTMHRATTNLDNIP